MREEYVVIINTTSNPSLCLCVQNEANGVKTLCLCVQNEANGVKKLEMNGGAEGSDQTIIL